jgi:hypothetical protein
LQSAVTDASRASIAVWSTSVGTDAANRIDAVARLRVFTMRFDGEWRTERQR